MKALKRIISFGIIVSLVLGLLGCSSYSGYYAENSGNHNNSNSQNYWEWPYDEDGNQDSDDDWDDDDWDDDDWDDDDIYTDDEPSASETIPDEKSNKELIPWGFCNSNFPGITGESGYYISNEDYVRLFSNLSSTERARLSDMLYEDGKIKPWSGSCYGMSVTSILAFENQLNCDALNEIGGIENSNQLSLELESLINYYHVQQNLSFETSCWIDFQKITADRQISELEKMISSGHPVLLAFYWSEETEENPIIYGHAVVAYEYGVIDQSVMTHDIYPDSGKIYTKCINIYDPNSPDEIRSLYYNTNGEWYYKRNNQEKGLCSTTNDMTNFSDDFACFVVAMINPYYINAIDYSTGELSVCASSNNSDYMAYVTCPVGNYQITTSSGQASISGLHINNSTYNDNIFVTGELNGDVNYITILMPQGESFYQINTEKDVDLFFSAGNTAIDVNSDQAGIFEFKNTGEVSVELNDTPEKCDITITADGDKPFGVDDCNTLSFTQGGSKDITITPSQAGFEVTGSDITDLDVVGYIDGFGQQVDVTNNSADSLLLTIADNKLTIKGDENGDGSFDTIKAAQLINTQPVTIEIVDKTVEYTGENIDIDKATVNGTQKDEFYVYYSDELCQHQATDHKAIGTYYVKSYIIDELGGLVESNVAKLKITKSKPTIKLKKTTYAFKESALKNKAKTSKITYTTSSDGKITFKKLSGNSKIKVNKNGKITVSKGLKKGKYKIKVSITAKATAATKKRTIKKTITINVK